MSCRLCAINDDEGNFVSIIKSDNEQCLDYKIKLCLRINVTEGDVLPTQACNKCTNKLLLFYDFFQEVQQAQIILQNRINKVSTFVTPESIVQTELGSNPISFNLKSQEEIVNIDKTNFEPTCQALLIHNNRKTFNCDICGKTTKNLYKHKRIHREKPYECEVCGKRFVEKSFLQRHQRTHTGEKPYVCDICGKSFAKSDNLGLHKGIHSNDKRLQCDICGKAFRLKSNLAMHRRHHTGEKPYECNTCCKKFTNSSCLKKHVRIHTGEKPYKCDICGKLFARSYSVTSHKRTHTGERPYQCNQCERSFKELSGLHKHKNQHCKENNTK